MFNARVRPRLLAFVFAFAFAYALALPLGAQDALFSEDFSAPAIDGSKWSVVLPYANSPPSTAIVSNGAVTLFRRAILVAKPSFPEAIDIQGSFRFVGDNDSFTVVLRSNLAVTNQNDRRGVQAVLQETGGRVFLIPDPYGSTPISASFGSGKNIDHTFRITDSGSLVQLFVDNLFTPVLSAALTNHLGDRLCLYNFNDTVCRARLDSFEVRPLQTCVFVDGVLARAGPIEKSAAPEVKLQSFITNAVVFYTLDGSAPTFLGTEYHGPFLLDRSATLRAAAYRPDLLVSSESPAIVVHVNPPVILSDTTPGGGTVTVDPPGATHPSNSVVTVTANPAAGWQFLRWEGALSGTSATNQLTLTNHLSVRAVFGTTLTLTVIGDGSVTASPPGPLYAYGDSVRFVAQPGPGSYFFRWFNALATNVSPATLGVTSANPGVSAIFTGLGAGQVSLTALLEGAGNVVITPSANVFTNQQLISLRARPDSNQVFIGWSGDLNGLANPASLLMDDNKAVTARFALASRFLLDRSRLGADGFTTALSGAPGAYALEASADLVTWTRVDALTNESGIVSYLDAQALQQPTLFYRLVAP